MLCPSYASRSSAVPAPGGSRVSHSDLDRASATERIGPENGPKIDLQSMQRALDDVLGRFGATDVAPKMLQDLAEEDPRLFFEAGVARLGLEGGAPAQRKRSLRLFDVPDFLLELVRSDFFSNNDLKDFCARHIREDSLLDVKLARLMPGRQSDNYQLETSVILRILDVLDEISPGPRLLMTIGHLTHYPERHIASKATLLVGRRLQNREWVERHLASTDPRIRANVAEALWSVDSALAAQTFRKCLRDENNRVHGNALIGLHLLGDRSIGARVRTLVKDNRPGFRQTAAWVIGKLQDPELVPLLEGLLLDSNQGVRQSAQNALEKLRGTAAGAEPSRNTGTDSAPLAPKPHITQPDTVGKGEPVATAPENTQSGPSEVHPVTPDPPGQDNGVLSQQRLSAEPFNIHLDGRYVTGD